jgi:hypothetical protein
MSVPEGGLDGDSAASARGALTSPTPLPTTRGLSEADVAAAAMAHRDRMVAAVRSRRPALPFDQLHSSEQIVLLDADELWTTIASQWCRPGEEQIEEFAATWGGDDLAAIVFHLGLPVKPRNGRHDYWERSMRQQVVDAALEYANDHPDLFGPDEAAAMPDDAASPDEAEEKASFRPEAAPRPSRLRVRDSEVTPPKAPQRRPATAAAASPQRGRRSPRGTAASRSADAMRALGELPLVGSALARAEKISPEPARDKREQKAQLRSSSSSVSQRSPNPPRLSARRSRGRLLELGGGDGDSLSSSSSTPEDSEDDDASDADWAQEDEDAAVAASARRGGRLLRDEFDTRLAETGVHRHSFAKGFLRNALREAAGRTLYQLYKDATAQWEGVSMHCKREALAHARTLDALLQAPRDSRGVREALEHVCRRLGGVHTAATTGSWEMCDRLEAETSTHSFVPDYFMATALKQVSREQAIRKSVHDGMVRVGKSSYTTRKPPRGGGGSGHRTNPTSSHGAASSGYHGDSSGVGSSSHNNNGVGKAGSRKK